MTSQDIYCIDTSALIDLWQIYGPGTHPGLWGKGSARGKLGELIDAGRLIAPRQVYKEIRSYKGESGLKDWAKLNKRMFVQPTKEEILLVEQINATFLGLTDHMKETPDADPFVVALASSKIRSQLPGTGPDYVVLTCEKRGGGKPRIPDACDEYQIKCLCYPTALIDFFQQEGWQFWEASQR